MCYPSEQSISSYEAFKAPMIFAKPAVFGTGKGTTARILDVLATTPEGALTTKQIGEALSLPARQLNKRLREQELKGKVFVTVTKTALAFYKVAA